MEIFIIFLRVTARLVLLLFSCCYAGIMKESTVFNSPFSFYIYLLSSSGKGTRATKYDDQQFLSREKWGFLIPTAKYTA
jgi:hypothetical protein